ncbi:hypothetical protein HDU97_003794 [Phlyctochytrium planicorne]|nr:hypothetical protein HDU97_003794 [Phlyctochytrium planicorne]
MAALSNKGESLAAIRFFQEIAEVSKIPRSDLGLVGEKNTDVEMKKTFISGMDGIDTGEGDKNVEEMMKECDDSFAEANLDKLHALKSISIDDKDFWESQLSISLHFPKLPTQILNVHCHVAALRAAAKLSDVKVAEKIMRRIPEPKQGFRLEVMTAMMEVYATSTKEEHLVRVLELHRKIVEAIKDRLGMSYEGWDDDNKKTAMLEDWLESVKQERRAHKNNSTESSSLPEQSRSPNSLPNSHEVYFNSNNIVLEMLSRRSRIPEARRQFAFCVSTKIPLRPFVLQSFHEAVSAKNQAPAFALRLTRYLLYSPKSPFNTDRDVKRSKLTRLLTSIQTLMANLVNVHKRPNGAREIWEMISDRRIPFQFLPAGVFVSAAHACMDVGRTDDALAVLQKAEKAGFLENIGVYGARMSQILAMKTFLVDFGLLLCKGFLEDCEDAPTRDFRKGLITSSFLFGCIIGAGVVSILADKLGRKPVIMLGGFVFTVGGAIQTFSHSIEVLVMSRVLSGVSIGMLSMSVPLYISETAPPQIRGRLTTIYQLMITFGIFVASCVNGIILKVVAETSDLRWRLAFAMQMIPGLALLVIMLRMPRSPRWLAEKGRHDEGLFTVARLRGMDITTRAVEVEYGAIRAGVEFERQIGTASWGELLKSGVRRRLIIGVVNQFFQQWTGINVILYYGSTLFGYLDSHFDLSSIYFVIVNAFINLVSTFPGMWGVERFGRRPLLVWGGVAMMVSHVMVFAFGYVSQNFPDSYRWLSYFAILGIYTFTVSFACTWGPVVWTYQSEIFPLRIRAKGTGLSTMSNWFWNFVIALVAPAVFTQISFFFYLVFAGMCFLMTLWTLQFIPETRGRTLEEMDDVFGDNMAVISTGDWDWRYDFRETEENSRRRRSLWRFGGRRRKGSDAKKEDAERLEDLESQATVVEGETKEDERDRSGPGRKSQKRSATPSPKRRRSHDSNKSGSSRRDMDRSAGPSKSSSVIPLTAAGAVDFSFSQSTESSSVPNTPITTSSLTLQAWVTTPQPQTPPRRKAGDTRAGPGDGERAQDEEEDDDEEEETEDEDSDDEEETDDEDDDDDEEDEEESAEAADGSRLKRSNSNSSSIPSRKSAGTPVPERFLRNQGMDDEEEDDEEDDEDYGPYGRRQEPDVDSLEEELGIAPQRRR